MENKFLVEISYDGSKFYGWNKQPNLRTIQGEIEDKLFSIFQRKVKIIASGRTDRYVHAISQIFTIEEKYDEKFIKSIEEKINEIEGLKINNIEEIYWDFSPRYNPKRKTYRYKIQNSKSNAKIEDNEYEFQYFFKVDINTLKDDSKKFIGTKNFASFTGKETYENYVRTIQDIKIFEEGSYIYIDVIGTGFMRFMVRNIVGTLLAKNRGKYSEEQFDDLFDNPLKGKSHYKAPGCGLYLLSIDYK